MHPREARPAALTAVALSAFLVLSLTTRVADAQYDRGAAVAYAAAYCGSRNPAYHDYSSQGGDCANFVSQCILAGGFHLSADCSWLDGWGCLPSAGGLGYELQRLGWTVLADGWAAAPPAGLAPGDVVIASWGSNDQMCCGPYCSACDHAMIVVETSPQVRYSAHTTDRCSAAWWYPNDARLTWIHGPNSCDCSEGQVDTGGCGNCGTHKRTCGSDCHWGGWSACEGQGPCAAGQQDTRSCCDCGSQTRTCDGNCQWDDWGACGGPDPNGGKTVCDTGESGPCAEGRMRCQQGCLKCARIHDPEPERCDSIDNNCNGPLNDGYPTKMGVPPPAFAAQVEDLSFRRSLDPNESDTAWVAFRNVGTEPWPRGKVWLGSVGASQGKQSPLYAMDHWPAWDVAGVLDHDVVPGSVGYLSFTVQAPAHPRAKASDHFQLRAPDGTWMECPSPSIEVTVSLTSASGASDAHQAAGGGRQDEAGCGCRQAPRPADAMGPWLLVAMLATATLLRGRNAVVAG